VKDIQKEAKRIMDSFMKELDKVKFDGDFFVHRDDNIRSSKAKFDETFADRILENAPETKKRWIQVEKKKW
tara:strand:- start:1752 stop:1964 length:213 start_codon:yes stop_codon:yes gene_type:complete